MPGKYDAITVGLAGVLGITDIVGVAVMFDFPGFHADGSPKNNQVRDDQAIKDHCAKLRNFMFFTRSAVAVLAAVDLLYTWVWPMYQARKQKAAVTVAPGNKKVVVSRDRGLTAPTLACWTLCWWPGHWRWESAASPSLHPTNRLSSSLSRTRRCSAWKGSSRVVSCLLRFRCTHTFGNPRRYEVRTLIFFCLFGVALDERGIWEDKTCGPYPRFLRIPVSIRHTGPVQCLFPAGRRRDGTP